MSELVSIFKDFGPYIFLPVIVHFIVNGLKSRFDFFHTVNGLRVIHFLPVILGAAGGLLLPEDSLGDKLLVGGGLGCLNLLIYKTVTVTIAKKASIEKKIESKK
jgi:hypothetical protein